MLALALVLLPVGLLLGLLFQWAAKLYVGERRTLAAAYAIESAGGVAGGILATGFMAWGLQNLAAATECPEFQLVRGDIRDSGAVDQLFRNESFDAVVHLAALAGVRPSLEHPARYADVNVHGTSVLLETACRGAYSYHFGHHQLLWQQPFQYGFFS